jgi:precorrin-2 dehydrogenase / sirohydrochlorin ferrochelatase
MPSKSDNKRVYYPVFLDITDKRCLVVGGGKVAERKVAMLLQFDARIVVVGPLMTKALLKLVKGGKITYHQRTFAATDLDDIALVFACTDNKAVNNKIKKEAARKNIPVNVVDTTDACDFIVPSIIRKGDLTIAVSTSGELPLLSRKLRQKIEEMVTDDYLEYLHIMGEFRKHLMRTVKEARKRSIIMEHFGKMDIREVIAMGLTEIRIKALSL